MQQATKAAALAAGRAAAVLTVACALLLAACGGGGDDRAERSPPTATTARAAPAPAEPPADPIPRGGLAVGLTEQNPWLVWSAAERPGVPAGFGPWRDRVAALRPVLHRILVDWSQLQPAPDAPPAWDGARDGCMRGTPPCASYAGLRDLLRAIRSQQRAGGGFGEVMVSIYGVPDWAARPPAGCERDDAAPRSRPVTPAGLDAYRALVRSLLLMAAAEDVPIRWWSAWNEPNGPFFVSPQRAACDADIPARSPDVYVRLYRALADELARAPGDQRLVLGELAGYDGPTARGASVTEFFDALPDDVVCSAAVVAQHAYVERGDRTKATGPVRELERALDRRPCARDLPIWVTETGVGGPDVGGPRRDGPGTALADCRALDAALREWDRDPRVDLAVQYTVRDDPAYPVGLADERLRRAWPAYDVWLAWGGTRGASAPAPPATATCPAG